MFDSGTRQSQSGEDSAKRWQVFARRLAWAPCRTISFRPHLSTLVLLFPVLVLVLLANLPGWRVAFMNPVRALQTGGIDANYEHGWPLTYLFRRTWRSRWSTQPSATFSPWDLAHGIIEFRVIALLADILAGVGILLLVGVLVEVRRRRLQSCLQFHLRELLTLLTLVAVALSFYAVRRREYATECRVYESLRQYNPQGRAGPAPEDAWELEGPDWLLPILGEDRYRELFGRLRVVGAGGDGLKEVVKLRGLLMLRLSPFPKNDAVLLTKVPKLEAIELADIEPPSETIELPSLPRLRALYPEIPPPVNPVMVTDWKIRGLAGLKSLESLYVKDEDFDDSAMVDLNGLNHLRWLILGGTKITARGLQHVRGATNLDWLVIARTEVDDSALPIIAQMKRLSLLDLSETRITDAGVESLTALKNLRNLSLNDTAVTAEGVERLRRALPDCTIDWSP